MPIEISIRDTTQAKTAKDLIELRFTNPSGDTEVWIIKPDITGDTPDDRDPQMMAGCGDVVRAYIDNGVDVRLAVQANSIDRMAKHIARHHDQLAITVAEECDFMFPKEEK